MRSVSGDHAREFEPLDGDLDLGGVGRAVWRAKKWIVGTTLLAFAGSAIFVSVVKPRYTAEAKALIENQESYFTRPDRSTGDSGGVAPDAEAVASQVQLVTSRDLAREAIKSLKLKGNPEFDPAASGPGVLTRIMTLLNMRRENNLAPEDRIFDNYFDRLFVFPIVKSRVLQIEFSSLDPELAAKAANTVADLYVSVQAAAKRDNARLAATSLAGLISDLRSRVSEAERKAEEFRAANGLMIGANNLNMNGQQLADLNTQLTVARTAQADSQAKSRLIRDMLRQGRISEVPDVANNDLIRKLSEQRANLRGQIASEGRTLLPEHPRLKELNALLTELDNNLRIAADKAARTLDNDAKIAGSRVENLQAALEQQRKTVGGASFDEARAKDFDREARLLKDQLEASTTKYQEALARQVAESTPSDARIISRAMAPQLPTFPKKMPIVIFATIAGLLLSAGVIMARELMSAQTYAPRGSRFQERVEPELTGKFQTPSAHRNAGMSGADVTARSAVMAISSGVPVSAGVEELANRIAEQGGTRAGQRILVTGADASVAAAEIAVVLGRALGRDRRVILVELDGSATSPGEGPPGLSDLLAGRADFESVIHLDRGSRLHLLPAGNSGKTVSEGLDVVIEALAHTYDCLILLAPPVKMGADVFLLAPEVDVAVLVVGVETSDQAIAETREELQRAGARQILTIVDEDPSETPAKEMEKSAA